LKEHPVLQKRAFCVAAPTCFAAGKEPRHILIKGGKAAQTLLKVHFWVNWRWPRSFTLVALVARVTATSSWMGEVRRWMRTPLPCRDVQMCGA